MSKDCPITSGATRKINKYGFNLYCATVCRAEFPEGCLVNCGWPEMNHTERCAVHYLCPCYNMMSIQSSGDRIEYVCRRASGAREAAGEDK